MNTARVVTSMALLSVCSCVQRTDLPVAHDLVELDRPLGEVVCHLRALSANSNLSFHYGTYGSKNSLASFRLIGEGYEVTIVTPKEHTYDVSAYDLKEGPDTRARALNAYNAIKSGMLAPLPRACSPQ